MTQSGWIRCHPVDLVLTIVGRRQPGSELGAQDARTAICPALAERVTG